MDKKGVAYSICAVAVVAFAVGSAGSVEIESLAVERTCHISGSFQRGHKVGANLVGARNYVKPLIAENLSGKAVSAAVDIQNLAIFGDGICAGYVNLCGVCFDYGLVAGDKMMAVYSVFFGQKLMELKGVGGNAAANAHICVFYILAEIANGRVRGVK